MNRHRMKFCAAVLALLTTGAFAQRTEVSVRKGKVIAETGARSVAVDAGQKVVLAANENPMVMVDDPLVNDALQLHKLIEAEKARGDLKIDSTFILVCDVDKDSILGAMYLEFPNLGSKATNVLTMPYVAIIPGLQVYDLNGNLLPVDMTLRDSTTASYRIHTRELVQPREHFKLIGVAHLQDVPLLPGGAPMYYKEGPLSYFSTWNITPNCLNYFRFILPRSAILIDTNRQVIATDSVDGRAGVTMRNYTGAYADGVCKIALLWPDQDGMTLTDIPAQYYGLHHPGEKNGAVAWRREMTKVRAGVPFQDQSTPVSALLSVFSAAIRRDSEACRALLWTLPSQQQLEEAGYRANVLTVLGVPDWPQKPGDGYVHPVWLCREGSLIHEFTQLLVHQDGRWYSYGTRSYSGVPEGETDPARIEQARASGYLTDWEVAGPYTQKGRKSTELFHIPFGPELPGTGVRWVPIPTETSGKHPAYVNLEQALYGVDQMVAYLRTRIDCAAERSARLEIYTDDGVKAWLNGELIHANNVSRGIPEQPDAVAVTLKQGTNELMLKVTDDVWSWGAVVRVQPPAPAKPAPGK